MTISEVSAKYDITQDTLRYYERIGLLPSVNRKNSGQRDFDEEDCRWIEFIKCMRGAGLPIEVLIEYVALFQKGDSTIQARVELLTEQRNILAEKLKAVQTTIDRLDYKIEAYETKIVPYEKELKPHNQLGESTNK